MSDTRTVVTLVNLNQAVPRQVVVQGGAYGEHRIESVQVNGKKLAVNGTSFIAQLAPGAGTSLTLTMKRYSEKPTAAFPEGGR